MEPIDWVYCSELDVFIWPEADENDRLEFLSVEDFINRFPEKRRPAQYDGSGDD